MYNSVHHCGGGGDGFFREHSSGGPFLQCEQHSSGTGLPFESWIIKY